MKLMKYSWLAALPMVFTACQDDMLMEKQQQQGVYTLTATMDKESADSRAQIVLNGTSTTKETFQWNEGDKFSLFELDGDGGWLEHKFNISENYNEKEPASSADFSTSLALTQGREFVAFYPACEEVESGKVQMTIDMTLPDNSKESWTEYFQNNMFMKARGTVGNTSADTKVNFTQLCGIIRITYKNTSKVDRTLGAIKVDGLWSIGGYCPLNKVNTFVPNVTQKGNAYGITFENGATVKAGSTEDFYILFLYNSVEGNSQAMSTVSVSDMDNRVILKTPIYSESFPVFQAGKCYWLNVTDNGNELLWSNDKQGDDNGNGENMNEVRREVSTFAELQEALAIQTNNLYINLKDNIELEGSLSVISPTTFEMNGWTLSMSENYVVGDNDAVIDVNARLNINNGKLMGKDGALLHSYYIKMSGTQLGLTMYGVTIKTGTAVPNAVLMDDDYLNMSNKFDGNTGKIVESTIQADDNAIWYEAKKAAPRLMSRIRGTIVGDVYIKTNYETLNAEMQFTNGSITGDLVCVLPEEMKISEYVSYSYEGVNIEDSYKESWSKAGRYVENQYYSVSTFDELRTAIETPQVANESTSIHLACDITLTAPLVANKPMNINGGGKYSLIVDESFKWGDADAAISFVGTTSDSDNVYLDNLTFKGSFAEASRYLIKISKARLTTQGVTFIGNGVANGIQVEDESIDLFDTSITVEGCALNFIATDRYVQGNVDIKTGTITGNVGFTANYKNNTYPNVIILRSGTINGDLIPAGTYASDVKVAFEGGTANGEGWADADISK